MGININELRAKRAAEGNKVVAAPPSKAKDLVRQWNAKQKEHRAAEESSWLKGKLVSHAELITYLEDELAKGTRSRSAVARDAGISAQTVANYIKKGKVQLLNAVSG